MAAMLFGGLQCDLIRFLVRMCKHRCPWSLSHFLKFTFEASDFFWGEWRRRRVTSWLFREICINQPRLCRVSWVNIWAREAAEWAGGRTCRWWKALDLIQHENAPSVCALCFFSKTLHVLISYHGSLIESYRQDCWNGKLFPCYPYCTAALYPNNRVCDCVVTLLCILGDPPCLKLCLVNLH